MDVNFEHYKVFYYCALYGSFSLAAQKLCVSQPAVTVAIRKFEKSLGFELFHRSRTGVTLTTAGFALYAKVAPACQLIFSAEEEIAAGGDEEDGSVHPEMAGAIRMGASELTSSLWLVPKLKAFRKTYPNVKVFVDFIPSFSPEEDLHADGYDFLVLNTPFEMRPEFNVTEVMSFQDVFICGREYDSLRGATLSIEELSRYPLVLPASSTSVYVAVKEHFEKHGVILEPAYQFGSLSMIRDAVAQGLGIGVTAYTSSMAFVEGQGIFRLKVTDPLPARKICIVTSKECPLGITADALVSHVLGKS